jgi:hypothetical protein
VGPFNCQKEHSNRPILLFSKAGVPDDANSQRSRITVPRRVLRTPLPNQLWLGSPPPMQHSASLISSSPQSRAGHVRRSRDIAAGRKLQHLLSVARSGQEGKVSRRRARRVTATKEKSPACQMRQDRTSCCRLLSLVKDARPSPASDI